MPRKPKQGRIVLEKKPKMFEATSTYDVPKTKLKKGGVQ